ncbi:o-succinylbenzoate--CoA ligase [Vibrio sp. JPW-9-11-11]|uniref:o-succinylbenzoate--CoA ligase n=1 Tax=Vibrio sp. JPW-9-11-11 TaxID=1416532 RepID=UPI001593D92A|nr:o-succinylbenzoate--CoA ligase [Vibrio sp. JPW-9-11-11]NVD06990.1 o-succinylbenzoate--CoA ligase [Vibrio sp. JPW-9-11-11]
MTESPVSPLQYWAQKSPCSLALRTPEASYTWSELAEQVNRVAAGLRAQGVGAGSVVTSIGKNCPEQLFILLACLELGAINALVMPQSQRELEQKLTTLYPDCDTRHVWYAANTGQASKSTLNFYTQSPSSYPSNQYQPNALATVVFTSGSTGNPKAVAHTSQQHIASAQGLLAVFPFQRGDGWLVSLPLYHVSGLAIVYRWLFSGAWIKLGSGELQQDVKGVTHASLVATQLHRLLGSGEPLALKQVLLGGSHIDPQLSLRAASQGIDAWLGYGMTEAASTVTAKRVDDRATAGRILANRQLKVEDGRIFIGGDTLAAGYYVRGELKPITQDGWFDSKDLGQWQGDELVIIGRADNQFISGGENIHCEEIERVLNQHPLIELAVVVPVDDSEFGQRPVAIIQHANTLNLNSLDEFLTPRLSRFKWPVRYYPMPNELQSAGIKVSRYALQQWLASQLSVVKNRP